MHRKSLFLSLFAVLLSGSSQLAISVASVYGWLQELSSFTACMHHSAALQQWGNSSAAPSQWNAAEGWRGWTLCRFGNVLGPEGSLAARGIQLPPANMHIETRGGLLMKLKALPCFSCRVYFKGRNCLWQKLSIQEKKCRL